MKLESILLESHLSRSQAILTESCDGLTTEQREIVEGIYNDMLPLIEASLTPDQVKQIFQQLEKQSVAGGANRTLVGAGVDVAKQANDTINKIGQWLQNTAPVQAFDQKFEQLKNKINTKFPDSKFLDVISEMGFWAKENPGKTAAIIGVLTAIASLAAGPVGGAIAGQILKGSVELLKGEKLSTAIGKGAKAAALGWLTGKAIDFIGNALADPQIAQANEIGNGIVKANYNATIDEIGGEFGNRFGNFTTGEIYGKASDIADVKTVWSDAVGAWKAGDYNQAAIGFRQVESMVEKLSDPEYVNNLAVEVGKANMMRAHAEEVKQFFGKLASVAQGAATGAATGEPAKKESLQVNARPLSEGQVYMVFNRVLSEAGFMDKAKELGGKALGAAAKGAQWAGKQATERVTSAKLIAAWKLEGSPTDSEALRKFLLDFGGIDSAAVDKVYSDMKIPTQPVAEPAAAEPTGTLYASTKKSILALNKKDKQRIMQYLQKQLGTV